MDQREHGVTMFGRWLARRTVARTAIACLALGLAALAMLALWGTSVTYDATNRVRSFNEISGRWNQVFTRLGDEDAALRDYLATNANPSRRPALAALVDSAEPDLRWLERHGGAVEAYQVRILRPEYESYNRIIKAILGPGTTVSDLSGYGELAMSVFTPLRGQVVANVERDQRELANYLKQVDQTNLFLRTVAIVIIAVDALLCLAAMAVLLGYQRRAERAVETSRYQSLHDPLTGLANRQLLAEHMDRVTAADPGSGSTALLLIDLNRFKEVNDNYGHHWGDVLLQTVADRMLQVSRDNDIVARLGGDEFAVLLHKVNSPAEVTAIGERLRHAIEQPIDLSGNVVTVGASVGASVFPIDCADAQELLRHADAAMYAAKRAGFGVEMYGRIHAIPHPRQAPDGDGAHNDAAADPVESELSASRGVTE